MTQKPKDPFKTQNYRYNAPRVTQGNKLEENEMKVTNKVVFSVFGLMLSVSAQANIPALAMVSTDVMIEKSAISLDNKKRNAEKATDVSSSLERKLQAQLDASLEQRNQSLEKK